MEHLKSDLTSMIGHIRSLPPNPPVEALKNKVKQLSTAIHNDIVNLPQEIQQIVKLNFEQLGWNIEQQSVFRMESFNVDQLILSLSEILSFVDNYAPVLHPTDEELASISAACDRLWDLDHNRLVPERDYSINLQHGKKAYDSTDVASEPLFTSLNERILTKPTFQAFFNLLDNYVAELGQSEVLTNQEKAENMQFLNLVYDTPVMQYVHRYLLEKGWTQATSKQDFIAELNGLWFNFYSRKARNDSSGFEHVFLGEINEKNEVVGLHNWIHIYLEEKKNNFNYKGYIKPKKRGLRAEAPSEREQLITIQFEWKGASKMLSSSFIGTSPEFEVALYTLCFYSKLPENVVTLGPYRSLITCYTWPPNPKKDQRVYIATSFPAEAP
eukprot:gene11689-15651_t